MADTTIDPYSDSYSEEGALAALDQLMGMPSLEDQEAADLVLIANIQQTIDGITGAKTWTPVTTDWSSADCGGDYLPTEGRSSLLLTEGNAAIPDELWEEMVAAVMAVVADRGFVARVDFKNEPGNKFLELHDTPTGDLTMHTTANRSQVVVAISTGCRLPQEAKDNLRTYGVPYDGSDPQWEGRWPFATPDPSRFQ